MKENFSGASSRLISNGYYDRLRVNRLDVNNLKVNDLLLKDDIMPLVYFSIPGNNNITFNYIGTS